VEDTRDRHRFPDRALRTASRPSFPSWKRRSTSLSTAYAAAIDDCLYALQPTIPHPLGALRQRHCLRQLTEKSDRTDRCLSGLQIFGRTIVEKGITHKPTKPYRPSTNVGAEHMIENAMSKLSIFRILKA
jgi:hypothetical protein